MFTLNEATCDCCGTVYRSISKKHYCTHCDKYYYVCTRCHENQAGCPSCGITLKRKSPPLSVMERDFKMHQGDCSTKRWKQRFLR
jgi:hypothetical protein